jgi:hypothetical protein
MANSGIFRLFWRHFRPMCKRCLRLTFRRNNRVSITLLQTNINEQIKQQFSNVQVQLQAVNALAVSVNSMLFPIFHDNAAFRVSFYATPETKVVKVKVIGLFQFKTYRFPVNINSPLLQTPIVSTMKIVKNSRVNALSTPQMNRAIKIKDEHIQPKNNDLSEHVRIEQGTMPLFIENVPVKGIQSDEIENDIKRLRNQ